MVTRKKKEGASEQEMAELAQHITHSSRTQNMYYECSNRIEQSVETYEDLAAARKSSGTSSEDLAARSSVTSELVDPSDEEASNNVLPGPISVPTLQASACSADSISSAPSVVFTSSLLRWRRSGSPPPVCARRRAHMVEEQAIQKNSLRQSGGCFAKIYLVQGFNYQKFAKPWRPTQMRLPKSKNSKLNK